MTIKAGVIGWPISHSLSPVLHRYWLRENEIEGEYNALEITPGDFTRERLNRLHSKEKFVGFNITVPHKEAAFAAADDRDLPSVITSASNLVFFSDLRRLSAQNTDWIGFKNSVEEVLGLGSLQKKRTVVLGAGGAARGVVYALAEMGAIVHVLNRTWERADRLVQQIGKNKPGALIYADEWKNWPTRAENTALVVNTTSGGMHGQSHLNLDISKLPANAAVCDIVYRPLETQLLKDAKARGHMTIDGLGMLMHQAVPSFNAFFGKTPQVTPGLRVALVEALAAL